MYRPQIKVIFSGERLIAPGGLSIIGGMLGKSGFVKRCNRIPIDKKHGEPQIKDGDVLLIHDRDSIRLTQQDVLPILISNKRL